VCAQEVGVVWSSRIFQITLTGIVCALAIPVYLIGAVAPIYTDEIVFKINQGHYFDDGETIRYLVPTSCGVDATTTPAILLPLRLLDTALLNLLSTPWSVRLFGIVCLLAWTITLGVFRF
jgi:hypothetical protein